MDGGRNGPKIGLWAISTFGGQSEEKGSEKGREDTPSEADGHSRQKCTMKPREGGRGDYRKCSEIK